MDSFSQSVRPQGPPGGMPAAASPAHFDQISELIPQTPPVNINLSLPRHFDKATELIPQMQGINIPVGASGSGAPPNTGAGPAQLQPTVPGVSPSVPGTDIPQGGQWNEPYFFARGGVIPDDGEGPYPNWRAEEAGYTTSSADANVRSANRAIPDQTEDEAGPWGASLDRQPQQPAPQQPAPKQRPRVDYETLSRTAAPSVSVAVQGLKNIFGLEDDGALPTPEGNARQQDGLRRMASGYGRMTQQEAMDVDRVTGLDQVDANEGMKNLIRLDKTVNFWLERGDKDKAEAAGAAVLLHGAQMVRNAGQVAKQAFLQWQQTGNPEMLQVASDAIKRANDAIPDGVDVEFNVDPETRQLVATTVNYKGERQDQVVDPRAVPGLLDKAMDGSAYWSSMFQIGQPTMAAQGANRAANQEYEQYKDERELQQSIEKEARTAESEEYRFRRGIETGASAGERADKANKAFFQDLSVQLEEATTPQSKNELLQQGMQHRYDNTKDRQRPIIDEDMDPSLIADTGIAKEDFPAVQEIARSLAIKNGALDSGGALEFAAQAIVDPEAGATNTGFFQAAGQPLVFNPALLPRLYALRRKYRVAQ